ncbi:MAG: 6-phosphogluconolactonase [Rhizobiales bacterium]|nr:6-phosphogluconolactonase [Hyphomicrobiales bacterium]
MPLERHEFEGSGPLAEALASRVAAVLESRIADVGGASLAVSGGSTPVRLFNRLANWDLDWPRVTVTLVDERWVEETSPRSNARLVREQLLVGPASSATFVPLFSEGCDLDHGAQQAEGRLAAMPRPFAAVILGMGADGHTASWFPDGDCMDLATDPACPKTVLALRSASAGEPRITLTLPVVLDTGLLVLHIEGGDKLAVLDRALEKGPVTELPVRAVLHQNMRPVALYWCG